MGGRGSTSTSSVNVATQIPAASGTKSMQVPSGAQSAPVMQAAGRPRPASIDDHDLTQQEVDAIIQQQQSGEDIDMRVAKKYYISETPDPSNGYSMAQNLNYKLNTGGVLNANEVYIDKHLTRAMHQLGQDMNLNRGDHDGVLKNLGAANYASMTTAQLKSALVGKTWTQSGYTSTSYDINKNPFLTGSQAGGREVVMHIKAKGSAMGVFANKKQAEVILAKGTNFAITDAKFSGKTVYPRVGGAKKQVILEVDVW